MNWNALLAGFAQAQIDALLPQSDEVDTLHECAAEVESAMQQLRRTEARLIEAMDALRNTTRPMAHGARETDAAA